MTFQIPEDITVYTRQAAEQMLAQARAAYAETFALANADGGVNATTDMLDQMDALLRFQADTTAYLATFAVEPTTVEGGDPSSGSVADRLAQFTADAMPGIADVAVGQVQHTPEATPEQLSHLVASSGSGRYDVGTHLTQAQAAELFSDRLAGMIGGKGRSTSPIFTIRRHENAEFAFQGDRTDTEVMRAMTDERRRFGEGGLVGRMRDAKSLTASGGWCAVSTNDYTIRSSYAFDGGLDVPTAPAPRGGVNYYPELAFTTVYGGLTGTNFNNLTEAQVIAGATKTFVEVGCPTPTELRLGVTALGIITNLLQIRALPEYSNEFVSGAQIAMQEYLSVLKIAAIQAGATAVNLAVAPWTSDTSFYSQFMNAARLAARDTRAQKRMPRNATIELLAPDWALDQVMADLSRRPGLDDPYKSEQWLLSQFAAANIRPQFLRGYQDAFSGVAAGPGAAVPIVQYPITLKFITYPAGAWVCAELDVINLSTIYDATRLAGNQRVELFQETGWRMIPYLTGTREYTMTTCPNGGVGNMHTIACS